MVDPDARDESADHDGVNRSTTRGGAMGYRIAGRCTDLEINNPADDAGRRERNRADQGR